MFEVLGHAFGLFALLMFPTVILVAVVVFYWRRHQERRAASREFLCDSCKYNTSRYCTKPMRPYATRCDTYRAQVDFDEVTLD